MKKIWKTSIRKSVKKSPKDVTSLFTVYAVFCKEIYLLNRKKKHYCLKCEERYEICLMSEKMRFTSTL